MTDEVSFLRAIQERPSDASLRGVLADWLEERGDPRGEVLRTLSLLTQAIEVPGRAGLEERLRALLASGVQPVGPFYTNSIGMKFALIWPGTFLMGSPLDDKQRRDDEPQHKVTLTKAYYLGTHQVTQEQWKAAMGDHECCFTGDRNLPVDSVSWTDCQEFMRKLSEKEDCDYRFPTEAEWEYACRAGTTTPFHFGPTISADQANFDDSHPHKGVNRGRTTPVGCFPPNAWGLFDMHGNVYDWCADWYGKYPKGECVDPQGRQLIRGGGRVIRGGSFDYDAEYLRSASRGVYGPSAQANNAGFRVSRTLTNRQEGTSARQGRRSR